VLAVPNVGELVFLVGGRLGTVVRVPLGLVVATEPRDFDEEKKLDQAKSAVRCAGYCASKHPADLAGYVCVQVLLDGDRYLDPQSAAAFEIRVPVCKVVLATAGQQRQLEAARVAWIEQQKGEVLRDLQSLERDLERGLSSASAAGAGSEPVTIFHLNALHANLKRLCGLAVLQEFLASTTPLSASPACLRYSETARGAAAGAGGAAPASETQTLAQRIKNAYRGIHAFSVDRRARNGSPPSSPSSPS